MLRLDRVKGDSIIISIPGGDDIKISIIEATQNVKLGISAPREYRILRHDAKIVKDNSHDYNNSPYEVFKSRRPTVKPRLSTNENFGNC